MYCLCIFGTVWPITSLRGIQSTFVTYENLAEQSTRPYEFPPVFESNLELWSNQLQLEVDHEFENVRYLVQKSDGDFTELEDRDMAIGNLKYGSEVIHPVKGRVVRFSKENYRCIKRFRTVKVPQLLYAKYPIWFRVEILISTNSLDESDELYVMLPSETLGAKQSLKRYLERLSPDSVMNKDLIDFAYMTKPMSSIHNDRIPNDISDELNDGQRRAVAASLNKRRSFVCVQGPPGTGKTRVVAEIIRQLVQNKQLTLICAPTNVAVDNVYHKTLDLPNKMEIRNKEENCLRLISHLDELLESHLDYQKYLNLSSSLLNTRKKMRDLKKWKKEEQLGELELQKNIQDMKYNMIKESLSQKNAIFCTIASSAVRQLLDFGWCPDVLIIDEAAQCLEPAAWAAIVNETLYFGWGSSTVATYRHMSRK